MKIALVTGGFDPLHSGHIKYMKAARKMGDKLMVGINSDDWLTNKKGKPFMPYEERKAVIQELKCVDEVIEFDDDDEIAIEEDTLDLAIEMMESKIQRAAGMVLINSRKNDVSDIHIEPREEGYKIRVRKDGVMQKFMSMSRKPGIQLVACLKNMAKMDIAER